ncbi:MAG: hypothetical protein LBM70_03580 [Victivallales bacterium]|nr:hypothetical protein [Victivallales bacterium]
MEEIANKDTGFRLADRNQYNLQTKENKWLFPEDVNPFLLEKHEIVSVPGGEELRMELHAPGWKLEVYTRLFADKKVFSRRIAWTRLAGEAISTKSSRMSLDGLVIGKPNDCTVVHPGHWVSRNSSLTGKPNWQMSAPYRNHMPGAVLYNENQKIGIAVTMQTVKSDYEVISIAGNNSVSFQTAFNVRANMKAGDRVDSGEELISVTKGSMRDAFASLSQAWELNGFRLKKRPAWTNGAVLYSAYVQGTTFSRWIDIGNFDNFRKSVLPHLKKLGVTMLWFNPFNQGRYGVYSYDMEPEVGSEADLRTFCQEAEKMGIRVLMDLIPHGPYPKAPYGKSLGEQIVKEHPEWISRNADGSFKHWWGGYSMDYANPGWQDEMRKLACHYITACDISGWRVDCARYSPDNELPTDGRIPSQSGTEGAITMMRRVHEAMDEVKPGCILLGETRTTSHLSQMEFIYDTTLGAEVFPQIAYRKPEEWVPQVKLFLDRDEASMPLEYASGLMRFSENHDTSLAIRRYGSGLRDSLLSLSFLIPGLPLINMDQEQGAGILIARLAEIRKRPEFIGGKTIYLPTGSSDPGVLTFTRKLPDRFSSVAVNFTGQAKTVELTLPPECRDTKLPFTELIDGVSAVRDGGVLKFELPAYGVRVFAFTDKNASQVSAQQSIAKKPESTKKGDLTLKNAFWNVELKNGFIVSLLDKNGNNVLKKMGYVSDHFAIRDGKGSDYSKTSEIAHTSSHEGDVQIATYTGKWSNNRSFRSIYRLDGKDLKIILENDPAENVALELGFGDDTDEWFVSALEGALRDKPSAFHPKGDEFSLVEKDLWIRKIRITHFVQKSGVHYQADAQTLDPITGQIAIKKDGLWSGIRFSQKERGFPADMYLRENGSLNSGTTLRLLPQNGELRFAIRADDQPDYPAGIINGKDWSLRTNGSMHQFKNSHFELTMNRNEGGGIHEMSLLNGTALLQNSQVYSDDGFFTANYDNEFGKYTPCPGTSRNNTETAMRISTNEESLFLKFGGELKRDAHHGYSALPKVAYAVSYRLSGADRIEFAAAVTPQPRPGLGGSLNWEFQIPQKIESVVVHTEKEEKTFKLTGLKQNTVLWNSTDSPLRKDGVISFMQNAAPVLSIENIDQKEIKSISIRTTAKGTPVFRVSFFDGDGCKQLETREFKCDLTVK